MARLLIVEDEERLARQVARVLGEEGYAVEIAGDGRSALRHAVSGSFDVLVVDWMLPDLDGTQVIRRLRVADVSAPILMLTARDQVEDRVEGLDAGADDYLPKPFAIQELLARLRALLRRRGNHEEGTGAILTAGDITLDPASHTVRRGDEHVELTTKEFALLATLLQRPNQVFTRSILLDTVWGASADVYTNVVDLYISYLRKKLDREGHASHIRTVRGVGYAFDVEL